jgi:hypothetical protein
VPKAEEAGLCGFAGDATGLELERFDKAAVELSAHLDEVLLGALEQQDALGTGFELVGGQVGVGEEEDAG